MTSTTPIMTASAVTGLSFTALRSNVLSSLRELYINTNIEAVLSQGALWCCKKFANQNTIL